MSVAMASGGTGGTFVLEHGAGAVEKKPSGAGFGWFNALTDSFVGNALKPIFTSTKGVFQLDLARPGAGTAAVPGGSLLWPDQLPSNRAPGDGRGSMVPQFLRRRQSFRQTTAAQQVSPVSGGRIKVARYLRLGDVEVSEEEDAGKHDEAKAQAMGGDWSTGTTVPPAQANRGGAPRGSPAAANQAGAPRAGQAVNPGGAPPRARPGRPWWQKGGTLLWKDRAPLDLGVGVLYDLDRRKLEPHARVRVGDFVCVNAWPEPSLNIEGNWRVPGTLVGESKTSPLSLSLRYSCPLVHLDKPLEPPAGVHISLNYEMGSGIFLTPGSVETDWTVRTKQGVRLRMAGGVKFPRRLPLEEGEDIVQYEVRALGLQVPW